MTRLEIARIASQAVTEYTALGLADDTLASEEKALRRLRSEARDGGLAEWWTGRVETAEDRRVLVRMMSTVAWLRLEGLAPSPKQIADLFSLTLRTAFLATVSPETEQALATREERSHE